MNQLKTHFERLKPHFEEKGWYLSHHDYYVGLTGYEKRKGSDNLTPRKKIIVSLNYCRLVSLGDQIKKNMWEVKTYWTFQRNIFTEFDFAWEMFLSEEKKYDPKTLNWSKLNDEEIRRL